MLHIRPATLLLIVAAVALPSTALAERTIDVSAGIDAGATSGDDDQVVYTHLRVGYELRPHLTISLAGQTGGATAGATGNGRWLGNLVGAVELWRDFVGNQQAPARSNGKPVGKLRGSIKLGGTHQHEAPRDSLESRPAPVLGGVDDDIAHRTAGVAGLVLVANLYETGTGGQLYAGAEITSMLWLDSAGPRWTFLGGLVGGFRVDIGGR